MLCCHLSSTTFGGKLVISCTTRAPPSRQQRIRDDFSLAGSPPPSRARTRGSTVDSPVMQRHAFLTNRSNSIRRKKTFQVAQELSDLVVYCQSERFKGFKETERVDSPLLPARVRTLNSSLENSPSGSLSSLHLAGRLEPLASNIYKVSSVQESEAKHLARKYTMRMLELTERQPIRCYPAGMRIDSSNYNPIPMWLAGIQMVALNYQTSDCHLALHTAFFSQNGGCGYILKPKVMRSPEHVLYKRFNPFKKELEGLHSTFIELSILSGQYVCQGDYSASPLIEVEVLGIPKDCFKYKTKMSPKNALNPIWEETLEMEVRMPELAFLRFTVVDMTTNLSTAQRVIPVAQLRQGYRTLPLRTLEDQVTWGFRPCFCPGTSSYPTALIYC